MKRPVVPFLTPPDTAVSHGEWILRAPGGESALPKEIAHWDYQTVLELAAPVWVDRKTLADACQIEWDSGLAVLVMARSNHTNSERVVAHMPIPLRDTFDLAVELELAGTDLGGRLTLETLVVATKPKPTSRLAPQRPGSILWRSVRWTDLEGVGTQFPTDTLDFAAAGLNPAAGWQFRIDLSDPDARFMSAARLTLNSGHPAIERLLHGSRDEGTEQLLRTLNWDIARQMVQAALASDDVIAQEVDHDGTSVAIVLRNLLARTWPTQSPATLRGWMEANPSRIEVHLQDFTRLLR